MISPASPRFSLIIPARNEEACLGPLLDSVDRARERYAGGAAQVEVVVADNASTDATVDLARRRGCRVAREERRIIAAVRNAGARSARGEVLAFVDADSRIHPETFNAIDRALARGNVIGGATGVRLERLSAGIAATVALMMPMVWVTGMDTGVVFCREEDFQAIGGYDERLRVAEDVDFLWRLRRRGKEQGKRLARVTSAKGIASTRKFDWYGEWHYLGGMVKTFYGYFFSRPTFDRYIQTYWYDDRR